MCRQKRRLALFFLVRRVMTIDGWLIANDRFFSFFFSLSSRETTCLSFFLLIFQFHPLCFYCLFSSLAFSETILMFLILSINYNFSYITFFQFGRYSFDFWFFFHDFLAKILLFSISSFDQSLCCFFFSI